MTETICRAAERWELSDLRKILQTPHKAVYSAVSGSYGDVILKCDRSPQLFSEYRMLDRLNGTSACRVYAFDADNGWLLEERILPGTVLREEPLPEERIRAFAAVFRTIHTPASEGETYLDWLAGIRTFCRTHFVEARLAEMAEKACAIGAELFAVYPERMLLHGDLHHDNLLRREDGTYTMIDPKGVTGPAIFDTPRFLLNELDTVHDGSDEEHIETMIVLLGKALEFPEDDLRKLFYMETVLANLWSYEDGEPVSREELILAETINNR